ncbi:MAG: heavy-metal-associated domain-containing protein [Clostridium sp.]|nr:MAG: heavy-metal-associated domain-containing protein [Clostridium sp.]
MEGKRCNEKNYKFRIDGLDCANCASTLECEISRISLINNVSISFMSQRLSF